MGILGLTTFIDGNFVGWERIRVHGKLIVDGYSSIYSLHSLEWANGGQYAQYRSAVRDFFFALRRAGIEPIVIFDGVTPEQKTSEIVRRKRDEIKYIHKHIRTPGRHCCTRILPYLCPTVYLKVLSEMSVQFYFSDGEADVTIARVANYYGCPVLSNDSDFFIFHLRGGYIPYVRFHWRSKEPHIVADVYHYEAFASQFRFQDVDLCYAIPAIVGNDVLPHRINCIKLIHKHVSGVERITTDFKTIFQFLSQFSSLDGYISTPLGEKTKLSCYESRQWYSANSLSCEELVEQTVLKRHDGSNFTPWLIRRFHCGKLSSLVVQAAVSHEVAFCVIPDDFKKPCSYTASQPIRQCIYALMECDHVVEYMRHGMDYSSIPLPALSLPRGYERLTTASICSLSHSSRQALFFKILECDTQQMVRFVDKLHKWQFVVAVTTFWARKTGVSAKLVEVLLLCFLICSDHSRQLGTIRRGCRIHIEFRESQEWLDVVHSFAEWQAIYIAAASVNEVLMEPLFVISPAFLYDGQIAVYLASQCDINIARFDINAKVYSLLKQAILGAVSTAHLCATSRKVEVSTAGPTAATAVVSRGGAAWCSRQEKRSESGVHATKNEALAKGTSLTGTHPRPLVPKQDLDLPPPPSLTSAGKGMSVTEKPTTKQRRQPPQRGESSKPTPLKEPGKAETTKRQWEKAKGKRRPRNRKPGTDNPETQTKLPHGNSDATKR